MLATITLAISLLVVGTNTYVALAVTPKAVYYHSIGTISSSISSTFAARDGVSKVRCFAMCTEMNCLIVGYGVLNDGTQHCRILSGAAVPTSIYVPLQVVSSFLTIYVPTNSTLIFVQKPYALLIKLTNSAYWSTTRDTCRNMGLGLYSPASTSEIQGLASTYNSYWIGTSDVAVEGTYRSEDGSTIPVPGPLWCSGEPNNGNSVEDCIHTIPSNCLNDAPCSMNKLGFCIVGK
ncbi:uncharacterized protein LOC135217125 [Macrobrachium nipponense]|uniref:uncharacterized protein LOC135217125 n=1 Tax=Macrobrachium nipponense TaxID=159736 RepID=UPI0030C88F31